MFPVLLLLWKNVLTRYWEITKNASAWRSEDIRDYAKVSVRFMGLASDKSVPCRHLPLAVLQPCQQDVLLYPPS